MAFFRFVAIPALLGCALAAATQAAPRYRTTEGRASGADSPRVLAKGVLSGEQRARSFAAPGRLDSFSATTAIPLVGYSGAAYARLRDPGGIGVLIAHTATSLPNEPLVRFNVFGGPRQGSRRNHG